MRKIFALLSIFLCLFSIVGVAAQETQDSSSPETPDSSDSAEQPETITETPETAPETNEQEQAPLEAPAEELTDAGTLPDSPFYFVDNIVEQVMVGDNPERALAYKEEKIAEAQAMIDSGNAELAQEVLDKALNYGDIVEAEVSPEMKRDVQESSERIQYALQNMRDESENQNLNVEENVDEVVEKEKTIDTASELVSKIGELCDALSKLDPLQYADTCKSKDSSPRWMREKDKELTNEQEAQAELFFNKLSQCFESPEQCDCKGMGVQSFEDFCIEKSESAKACFNGDKTACKTIEQSDPSDLLPSYLLPVFEKVSSKYMGSQMELNMPEECAKAGATTPKECNKIMFSSYSPQECIDAGLTGESRGDEIKCRQIMFESNTPQQCIDAGISATDPDAPRKCSKIMFALNAPQQCIDAGITGESRDDQKKCNEIMNGMGGQMGMGNGPRFNKDCNTITDANEKIKCYEEFYNNAQVNTREDFAQREFGTEMTEEMCQSQQQTETLKQDCIKQGMIGMVEMRNGCPWVICVNQGYNQQMPTTSGGAGGNTGMKCPDGICDDYERMNPYACPIDCGYTPAQQQPQQQQMPPQGQMPPMEQQPYQQSPTGEQPPIEPVYVEPVVVPISETPITETPTTETPVTAPVTETPTTEPAPITGESVNSFLMYYWS